MPGRILLIEAMWGHNLSVLMKDVSHGCCRVVRGVVLFCFGLSVYLTISKGELDKPLKPSVCSIAGWRSRNTSVNV